MVRLSRSLSLLAAVGAAAAMSVTLPGPAEGRARDGDIVVANRGSANLSVINTETLSVRTISLPTAAPAEPMYVNHWAAGGVVFVGDRANNQVLVLDDEDYTLVDTIAVGARPFHQWIERNGRQLWVVGDVSDTVTVVDPVQRAAIKTIPLPADLAARGGSPHDVFVDGQYAFVSVLGLSDGTGVVLRYSTRTFTETGRIATGGDPHLFIRSAALYVESQAGSRISAYHPQTLRQLGSAAVPSSHGIWVTNTGHVLTTNIAGGGTDAVWRLDRHLGAVSAVASTAFPTPHNLAVDGPERQLFVTHSGPTANRVTVFALTGAGFGAATSVTVGTNPFGIGLVI
jgi:DNA-binding beta-propeller fold protein YncE